MPSNSLLPVIDPERLRSLVAAGLHEEAFDLLVQPLHEALFRRQSYEYLTELPAGPRMLLSFDYIRMQAGQGGFIQLIQNGYILLLLPVIEGLQQFNRSLPMAQVLDDVLKVFVLNKDALSRETTVAEFSRMYEEFKEFEALDQEFKRLLPETVKELLEETITHPEAFYRSEQE